MKLAERLPDSITVNGKKYKVNLDFRNVLQMMEVLQRDDLLPSARDYNALKCIMRKPPRNITFALAAVKAICFPDIDRIEKNSTKAISFEQDADLIRAAFLQSYGIDLWTQKLHWIEFSALLSSLPEGSRLSEIISIRLRPTPKATKYNAEERKWLAEAKAKYAIRMTDKEMADNYNRGVSDVFHALLGMQRK